MSGECIDHAHGKFASMREGFYTCGCRVAEQPARQNVLARSAPDPFVCQARVSAADPPQDCGWPFCGCDPKAEKVIDALAEMGALKDPREAPLFPNVKERTLLKLLLHRAHGGVSFTPAELHRADQQELEAGWDGHRYTLRCRWP